MIDLATLSMVNEIDAQVSEAQHEADGPARFGLSMRLVRELLAADASVRSDEEAQSARPAELLTAALSALRLSSGAILQKDVEGERLVCVAARGVTPDGEALLTASGESSGGSRLPWRALGE